MDNNISKGSVSVIIPMYNSEATINRALNSIKNQTAFDYIKEVIIVNDGSTDKSLEKVEKYIQENPDMPIEIINKNNGGVSSARNAGMKKSKGEWLALLDSDDEWVMNKLKIQAETINDTYNKIDFLGGSLDSKCFRILGKKITGLYRVNLKDLCIKMFPQTSTVIFKRKVYEAIGGFDENQSHAEDGNLFMKICLKFNYYYLPVQMVIYDGGKVGFGSGGLSGNLKKMHEGNLKNIRELNSEKSITLVYYIFLRVFYELKHLRRIILTKFRV